MCIRKHKLYLIFHFPHFLRLRIIEKLEFPFPLAPVKVVVARAQLLQHRRVHRLSGRSLQREFDLQ